MLKYYLYATVYGVDKFIVAPPFDDLTLVERYIKERWPKAHKPSTAAKYTWQFRQHGRTVKLQVFTK